jgi:RNA polymerase sigma-70 factor (ECF subfamily)
MSNRPADDASALVGRLYDTYGAALYRYASFLLADPVAAEDAVHQVFTAVLKNPPRLDDGAHYLRRAVRNECYSHLRRRKRSDPTDSCALLEPVADDVPADERIALERAIRQLSPEQREVIHLHVFEGLTFREIAEATDTSINTIAGRYRYALAALKQTLTTGNA